MFVCNYNVYLYIKSHNFISDLAYKMNDIQSNFDKLFELLHLTDLQPALVSECISMQNAELSFKCFDKQRKVKKEDILGVYKLRYDMEKSFRPNNNFVIGYADLLPSLEKSALEFVNISLIISEKGGFIIFSDYDYSQFIGILRSKRTLNEIKEKQKGYEPFYKRTVFKNGKLIQEDRN